MTPAQVADLITERLTDVTEVAAKRYPNNLAARRVDEVAQLRLLVETAAEHLRQFDREREQLDELLTGMADCPCEHAPDSLNHFEVSSITFGLALSIDPDLVAAVLAVAVGRLAAARKAGAL